MSELNFWNTLTRTKEAFEPIDDANVRMYVCGPTVYDFAHIGNARPVIVFDVLYRLLRHAYPGKGTASDGSRVTYVRNITDVDDKINARALRDYPDLPLNEAIAKVTEKTAERFHKDAAALGCLEPTHEPRATAHIDGMIAMIQTLIDKGNAYVTSGREGREVLFAVGSMPDYGKLSNRKLEDQQAGARIAVEDHKRNPADFVLWKESAADEPGWGAVFSENGETTTIHGRPGWHIECSVMSRHHLGEVFDIHGGGLDLIFPHHENEIAQSCCAHGKDRMANLWMHNGFLQVEGRKMSKSEGNFVTIAELLETDKFGGRKWPGEVLRLAMLMTHYREPIDFSVKRLEEALSIRNKLADWAEEIGRLHGQTILFSQDEADTTGLANDLSVHSTLLSLNRFGKMAIDGDEKAARVFMSTLNVLGFEFLDLEGKRITTFGEHIEGLKTVGSDVIQGHVKNRLAFIAAKNWPEADKIRNELLAQGIQLKDGKDPETGERVTTWEVKR